MTEAGAPDATYAVVELRKGPGWAAGVSPGLIGLQLRHLRTLWRLRRAGLALVAGPTPGDGDLRGLVICRADDVARVLAALQRDPAVQAGRLSVRVAGGPRDDNPGPTAPARP